MSKKMKINSLVKVVFPGFLVLALTCSVSAQATEGYYPLPRIVSKAGVTPTNDDKTESSESEYEVSTAQSGQYPNPGLAPVPQPQDPPLAQDYCAWLCGTNILCLAECYQMISNVARADSDSTLNTVKNPSSTRKTFQYPDPSLAPTPDPCSHCGGNIECPRVCLLDNIRY